MLGVTERAKRFSALPKAITPKITSGMRAEFEYAYMKFSNIGSREPAGSQCFWFKPEDLGVAACNQYS